MGKRPGHHRGNIHHLKIQLFPPDTALDASHALLTGGHNCFGAGFPDFVYQNNDTEYEKNQMGQLFSVGDVGYLTEDDFLFISDRKRDMVISGGVNIYPSEIEALIVTHPNIQDCAVFGIPDEEFGESLAAVVEPTAPNAVTAEEVQDFVRDNMARYKVPRLVELDSNMPREDSGKIRKRELRQKYWEDAGRSI